MELSSNGGHGCRIGETEPGLGRRKEKGREEGDGMFLTKVELSVLMVEAEGSGRAYL